MKKLTRSLTMMAALAFAAIGHAHTRLVLSVPAADSKVTAPAKLELKFSDLSQLQAISLQQGNAKPIEIKSLPQEWGSEFSVPLPPLSAGAYVATWTVETDDGHTNTGKIRFTVIAPATGAGAQQ